MATLNVATHGPDAWIEVDGTENADGSIVVDVARWKNLTDHFLSFTLRRGTGVSIITRTVNPNTNTTQANVPGSTANRTLVTAESAWFP